MAGDVERGKQSQTMVNYSAYEGLQAENTRLRNKAERLQKLVSTANAHLEKMLQAACWFHEGPYGPSPDKVDYEAAKAFHQALPSKGVL